MTNYTIVNNVIVIRVEDSNKLGPFQSPNGDPNKHPELLFHIGNNIHTKHMGMLSLSTEFRNIHPTHRRKAVKYKCAYGSFKHFQKFWDDGLIELYEQRGFSINKISLVRCILTLNQVFFCEKDRISTEKIQFS